MRLPRIFRRHEAEATRTPQFAVVVTHHAVFRARTRHEDWQLDALTIAGDVIDALRSDRVAAVVPETSRRWRARRGAVCAWTQDRGRAYVIASRDGGWVVLTTLPPLPVRYARRWHPSRSTTMRQAFAEARARGEA